MSHIPLHETKIGGSYVTDDGQEILEHTLHSFGCSCGWRMATWLHDSKRALAHWQRHSVGSPRGDGGLIVLAGAPGVGKTAVRQSLAEALGRATFGPDDHPRRWTWVLSQLDRDPNVLLECCKLHRGLRRKFPNATVVELVADRDTRRKRLVAQGLHPMEVESRLNWDGELGYEEDVVPDLTVDAMRSTDAVVADLARALAGGRVR